MKERMEDRKERGRKGGKRRRGEFCPSQILKSSAVLRAKGTPKSTRSQKGMTIAMKINMSTRNSSGDEIRERDVFLFNSAF